MRSAGFPLFLFFISIYTSSYTHGKTVRSNQNIDTIPVFSAPVNMIDCGETCSSILLNSFEQENEWEIVSGPTLKGIPYPAAPLFTRPFPSWEMDRYTADSSYFRDCDWMTLPDKRKVVNTVTRVPIVFVKKFTTHTTSAFKLLVKTLYDNMAYLYIDSIRIPLNHHNADINRFIKELQPELSSFVSIPATFNFSYNASFYAGHVKNLLLGPGEHTVRIELFNNANELGCIIKGMLMSANNEKVFCASPIKDEQGALASILVFRDNKTFPGNKLADTLYTALMQSVKTSYWINSLVKEDQDIISADTLLLKKGDKINITPGFISAFHNGSRDTVYTRGSFKKLTPKAAGKQWNKTFVFDARIPGTYLLEINCESPADAKRLKPGLTQSFTRIVKVR